MTKEEAIDIVKCLAWHDLRPSEEDIEQAIKALEQEPVFDKIKAEVLEYIDDLDIANEICGVFDKYKTESEE